MKRAGIVLCGGLSRRMGRPKALLPWFGRSMVEHVLASLAPCVDELLVVTSRDVPLDSLGLDARIVVDREPGRGPLAALRDGLAAARAELAFVTASDAPFLVATHVERLFERAQAQGGAAAATADGHLQVLSAVYPCRAWHEAEALLSEGRASPTALLERIGFAPVAGELRDGVGAWTGFNTPDEYLARARHRDPAATALVEWRVEWSRPATKAVALGGPDSTLRTVAIGRLSEVLRAAAPQGVSLDERLASGGLRISLAGREFSIAADAGLPIGPGDRLVVQEVASEGPDDLPRRSLEER